VTYLLDTCAVSDFVRGDPSTLARVKNTHPQHLAVSSITLMEVEYGLMLKPSTASRLRDVLDSFFSSIDVLPFDSGMAGLAASLRSSLRRSGRPIGAYDLLIAATALERQCVLVTSNTREFARIDGLKLEDWRSPIR